MGRPKTGVFTVAKSITLDLENAAWLSKQCQKKNLKLSTYINHIIDKEKTRVENIDNRPRDFCIDCNDMTPHNRDFSCGKCGKHNEALKRRVNLYMNGPKQ